MIYVIPDTQARAGVKNPLIVVAHHICDIKPRHVIHLGDHWDMPSLSQYDKGKKSHRVHSYLSDMNVGNAFMYEFWEIIKKRWPTFKDDCVFILMRGNHEFRRERALEYGPDELLELMETLTFDDNNWDMVIPFLEVAKIHGIEFSHYFQNDGSARPIGTAKQLINKRHVTCIAGHKQSFDYAEMLQGKDKTIQTMIVGSCYYHDENYKTHTNHHWRGTVLLYQLENKAGFDYARYSLETLDEIYKCQI
jgi:hypothetical protein